MTGLFLDLFSTEYFFRDQEKMRPEQGKWKFLKNKIKPP